MRRASDWGSRRLAGLMGVALTAAALAPAPAMAAEGQRYAAQRVELRHVAAAVTIIPEARADIAVEATAGAKLSAPTVRVEEGAVILDGGLANRITACTWSMGGAAVTVRGLGGLKAEALPRVTIRTPQTLRLYVDNAFSTEIGPSEGGEVAAAGCGRITVGAAKGPLSMELRGSGDATLANVSGPLTASVRGSGDLTAAAAQSAKLSLQGSGTLSLGPVAGALEADLGGSGDIDVARAEGPVTLRLAGSGDLTVREGRAPRLTAQLRGSGDLTFDGAVEDLEADLSGSGDIVVGSVTGARTVRVRGSGDVTVGR